MLVIPVRFTDQTGPSDVPSASGRTYSDNEANLHVTATGSGWTKTVADDTPLNITATEHTHSFTPGPGRYFRFSVW